MTTERKPLGLYIPERRISDGNAPYLEPRRAERWVEELPTGHVGETARLVYKALADLNRSELPVNHRYRIMEMFRAPADYVCTQLDKHYVGQPFPLSAKPRRIAELAREMAWEMAIGYKIVIDAALSGFSHKIDNRQLLTTLYRTMDYLSRTLVKAYLVYAPPPSHVWLELHHLYLFSEHNDLHDSKVKDPLEPEREDNTIGDLYRTAMLMSLANPYRLPQKQILWVRQALAQWNKACSLLSFNPNEEPPGLFAVDMEGDQPPSYVTAVRQQIPSYLRVLNTSALTDLLRQASGAHDDSSLTELNQRLSQATLRRLTLAWGGTSQRLFARKNVKQEVRVTLGLNACHYFIEHEMESEEKQKQEEVEFDNRAHFDTNDAPPEGVTEAPDIWAIAANPSLQISVDLDFPRYRLHEEVTPLPPPAAHEQRLYSEHLCELTNESVAGCRLRWNAEAPTRTVVGSLIAMHPEKEDGSRWRLGVVRWLKHMEAEALELGVELLAPYALAVATRNITRKSKLGHYMRALILPEQKHIEQPQTIITPAVYRLGDKLGVAIKGHIQQIRLTKLVEQTGTFNQFEFNVLKVPRMRPGADKLDRLKNFDSLWQTL